MWRLLLGESFLEQSSGEHQGHEPLLGSVVEVPLDPAALGVPGLDDPRPRGLHLCELGPDLRLQPLVVDGEAGGRGCGPHQGRLIEQWAVVDDRGQRLALALDHRDGALGSLPWQRHGPSSFVHELAPGREPVREVDRRIVQRARQRIPEADVLSGAEIDDEVADPGALDGAPEQTDQERDGHGQLRDHARVEEQHWAPRVGGETEAPPRGTPSAEQIHRGRDDLDRCKEKGRAQDRREDPTGGGGRPQPTAPEDDERGDRRPG